MLGAQFGEVSAHQPGKTAVLREQLVGEVEGVIALGTSTQDNGQGLCRRERLGAKVLQALAW